MTEPKPYSRWRGLVRLVADAVEHGSRAIEHIHLEQSQLPFQILEQIPETAATAKVVHAVHDVVVKSSYASVRLVTKAVAATLGVVIDAVEAPEALKRSQESAANLEPTLPEETPAS